FSNVGEQVFVEINENSEILFQRISYSNLNPNESFMMSFDKAEEAYINVKDLIGIFNFASNLEEIASFIRFNYSNKDKITSFSGVISLFHTWKDLDNVVNEGALELS